MKHYVSYVITLIGASLWGVTGLFVDGLYNHGFSAWEIVAIRLSVAAVILLVVLGIAKPSLLKIEKRHILHFVGLGVLGIVFFNWCYFTVMKQASLSIAVVLLYTMPIFVTVLSRIFFREQITPRKITSVAMTLVGCALAIQLLPIGNMSLSASSIGLGLCSAFFCGLYSLIGKEVGKYYHYLTVTFYALMMGCVFIFPTSGLWQKIEAFQSLDVWIHISGIALLSTLGAYILYTYGLTYIESSKAAILGAMEPIVAIILGVLVFQDNLTLLQGLGIGLVIGAAFITVIRPKRKVYRKT
ncbi:DMT family transporter [Gracilibacillus phocaeensis]|nr:EamA family transporter [Gracilibacillus phocaeensis]